MTERDWLNSSDLDEMLEFAQVRLSERKLRLFACACCRRIWSLLADPRSRAMVELAERFADGEATVSERDAACGDAWKAVQQATSDDPEDALAAWCAATAAWCSGREQTRHCVRAAWDAVEAAQAAWDASIRAERRVQCDLLRDVAGNPFQPVRLDPAWLQSHPAVVQRARTIYEQRGFDSLGELADLLAAEGCPDKTLLLHCRSDEEHERGCWALDLILSKDRSSKIL